MRPMVTRFNTNILINRVLAVCATLFISMQCALSAYAEAQFSAEIQKSESAVVYQENGPLSDELNQSTYCWSPAEKPHAVVLAIHGLAMHGSCFDNMARNLADQGCIVVATDMRGYGAYMEGHEFCVGNDCKAKTNYDKSYQDLASIARLLRERYPSLPLFAMGESLGGAMAIKLGAINPELVDGLILSAPAVKRHNFIDPCLIADSALVVANPRAQLDLTPFVRRCASDDPKVVDELINDPLLRRHLSAYELLQASNAVRKTISYVPVVPADTPVLVIQGSADRCIKPASVMALLSHLRSSDQTVKWFHERGHILIETGFVKPDTLDAVVGWVNSHISSPAMQAKCNRTSDVLARAHESEVVGVTANAKSADDKVMAEANADD